MTATAREGVTPTVQGAVVTNDSGSANTAGVDTVFADAAGATDGAEDGTHSAGDDYTVAAADISVFKSSVVISDPINGTTNPKAIPGATIEYCISVTNASGSATATGVSISDSVPNFVTFVGGSILIDGTVASPGASQTCSGGSAGGSFADPVVSGTLSNIAAGVSRALIFRVTVD